VHMVRHHRAREHGPPAEARGVPGTFRRALVPSAARGGRTNPPGADGPAGADGPGGCGRSRGDCRRLAVRRRMRDHQAHGDTP
jgi:hypothetical protein